MSAFIRVAAILCLVVAAVGIGVLVAPGTFSDRLLDFWTYSNNPELESTMTWFGLGLLGALLLVLFIVILYLWPITLIERAIFMLVSALLLIVARALQSIITGNPDANLFGTMAWLYCDVAVAVAFYALWRTWFLPVWRWRRGTEDGAKRKGRPPQDTTAGTPL